MASIYQSKTATDYIKPINPKTITTYVGATELPRKDITDRSCWKHIKHLHNSKRGKS